MIFKPLSETEEAEHSEDTAEEEVDQRTDGDDDSSNDIDDKDNDNNNGDNNHNNDEDNNDNYNPVIVDKEAKNALDFLPLLLSKKIPRHGQTQNNEQDYKRRLSKH